MGKYLRKKSGVFPYSHSINEKCSSSISRAFFYRFFCKIRPSLVTFSAFFLRLVNSIRITGTFFKMAISSSILLGLIWNFVETLLRHIFINLCKNPKIARKKKNFKGIQGKKIPCEFFFYDANLDTGSIWSQIRLFKDI